MKAKKDTGSPGRFAVRITPKNPKRVTPESRIKKPQPQPPFCERRLLRADDFTEFYDGQATSAVRYELEGSQRELVLLLPDMDFNGASGRW
jgi:hypothetical protein